MFDKNKRNVMDVLRERGFIKQTVYEEDLYKQLGTESTPFYIGFDPTADSLHVGHFLQMVAMKHMQMHGHRPIALIGGGTGYIGDPSGRSDMRGMMTPETIRHNCECFKRQMERFIRFDGEDGAMMVNNADWLLPLNYIEFLREIGVHFSVNKMLSFECFKSRMERGLNFLEFNYMLMQAYDFLVLNRKYGVKLELGGDDQWANILAGADLIRRKEQQDAFAMTFTLLTTAQGVKMGKTASGAVWLDPNKTSPYDFYQYWRNIDDADVEKCLKLLTFVELDEISELTRHRDERMNGAKERLAFEVTALIHGEEEAARAQRQARAAFSGSADDIPSVTVDSAVGRKVVDIMAAAGIAKSKSEARKLIEGGGVSVGDLKVNSVDAEISDVEFTKGFVLHKGKKVHVKVEFA